MFQTIFVSVALAAVTLVPLAAESAVVTQTINYEIAGHPYEGYLAYDKSIQSTKPGILVAHNWMGITDETRSRVNELAQLGYVVFAVDLYGKGIRPKNSDEAAKLATALKTDRLTLRARMQEGLKVLRQQSKVDKAHLGAIGYCFGGTSAIELARAGADLKSVVSFHGGLDSPKPEDGKHIHAKLLVLHGADDPFEKPDDLVAFENEMRQAKVDWQLIKYGNAVHSFTEKGAGTDNSKGAAYNALADKRSWAAMKEFLKETL